MTKYVISGYIGFDNFGDEAIAKVLTSHLKKNGAEKITLISSNPEKTSKLYDVESVGMLNFLKSVYDCDVLISGGGSLLQDITSLKSLVYYLGVITIALVLRKKVVIFAQGFTPFRTKFGKLLTGFILKKCHKITVRDEKSQQLLSGMGIESELVSDPVFIIEVPKSEHSGVGIQLRSFSSVTTEFLDSLANQILTRFQGEKIKLISLQDSLDLKLLEEFGDILKSKGAEYEILSNLGINDVIKIISSLKYLVGMRFHACLIAAKAGVRVLGINYDIKVETLANQVGFSLVKINGENLEKEIEEIIEKNKEYTLPETKIIILQNQSSNI